MSVDVLTKRWIRDASDEYAIRNGCWFDEKRGEFVVTWMHDYLRLYEGEAAGQPFECKDWQYEAVMRLFGWVRDSDEWGRVIRRFRKACWFVPKKNKKSPTLAAIMLYMLCGDGEMGQKCFPGAKDGAQIRQNVVQHVHEMVRQSEELFAECKINKQTGVVFHTPTRSSLYPLSSDNIASQKSKEGLNGSTFIDEVHVVDEPFIRRISRAGISRAEPMHVEVSTAGDDVDSYGYRRNVYANGVISGEIKDDQTLGIVYAAPADLSDTDLLADPIKYGKMANPAWGHTIKQSEYLADFNESKQSPRMLADFKMYRLDIWQASSTPWLSIADWERCPTDGRIDDERPCFAGLDLSSKMDFTAWVIVQWQKSILVVRGHYWISETRAQKHSNLSVPIEQWEQDGYVTICPNNRIDYRMVKERIAKDTKRFSIDKIGHDPWNAESMRQDLEYMDGVTLIEVSQNYGSLSDSAKTLEALVLDHEIDHGGDPVLAFMARNVTVVSDTNDNIRPSKKDTRTNMKPIDGIASTVIAMSVAEKDEGPSVYEQSGALFL